MSEKIDTLSGSSCWIISDGKAGVETQCLAIAEQLELDFELMRVAPRRPWRWLAPYGPTDPKDRIAQSGTRFSAPYPDLIIAGGRTTVPYVRALRRKAGSRTFTVFLQDPRTGPGTADLIWVPEHDRRRGPNVFTTLTTPHRLTLEQLASRRAQVPDAMNNAPAPRLAVLVGGDSRTHTFTDEDQRRFLTKLEQLAGLCGSMFVTTSRRTPSALSRNLTRFMEHQRGFMWDGTGDNPLHDFIAHADRLVVTADSANMVCEACVSGRPVHLFHPSGGSKKFSRLHHALETYGAVRTLDEQSIPLQEWSYTPLSATEVIADEIRTRWTRHRTVEP